MPLLADRVRETTTTVGTGAVSLGGAVVGFQSFNAAFVNGSTVYYVIQYNTEWEIGIGTVGTGTLSRDTVLQSSNADALVPFSAGAKDVFCSYVADRAVTTSDAATLTNKTIEDYTNNVAANSTHFRIKATGTIAKGAVVKATGFNPGEQAIQVAVVTSATDLALGIAEAALTTGQFGLAVVIGELFDINTNGFTVGAVIYSNGLGGYTETKPSSGTYQPLGWVVRSNSSNGVIAVNIVAPLYVETSTATANTVVLRDGSGDFSAGTITANLTGNISGTAPAGTLTGTTLASNVISSSLTSVGTLANLTVTNPITGSVTGSSGSTTGNAATATALQTARNINGVSFNGTADITVTAAAGTLTGNTLASGVTASSLTSVGTLSSLTVSGTLAVDTDTLFVDASNNRVGIGTTTPAYPLQVRRAGGAGSLGISIDSVGGTDRVVQYFSVQDSAAGVGAGHAFYYRPQGSTTDTLGVLLDELGNLGVGTSSQSSRLHVLEANRADSTNIANVTVFTSTAQAAGVGGTISLGGLFTGSSYAPFGSIRGGKENSTDSNYAGYLAFQTIANAGVLTERARLDSSGNLGLGVTPSANDQGNALFLASGREIIYSGPSGYLSANATYSAAADRYIINGFASSYVQSNGTHVWRTAPSGTAGNAITFTQAMTLDASSNLTLAGQVSAVALVAGGGSQDRIGIQGLTAGSGTLFNSTNAAANAYAPLTLDGSNTRFNVSGTERMRLDASGNLGLGVTPSAWASTSKAIQLGATGFLENNNGGSTYFGYNAYRSASGWKYTTTGYAQLFGAETGGNYSWYTAPSGTAGNAITFTQAMTLNANGNLSVGTTNSTAQLTVKAGSSDGVGVRVLRNASGVANIQLTDDPVTVANVSLGYDHSTTSCTLSTTGILKLEAGSAERARITAGGDFVVGATSTTFRIAALVAGGADREILQAGISGVSNGFTVRWNHSTTKTHVQIIDIPTSSAGLPAGTLWSDAGTIKIA